MLKAVVGTTAALNYFNSLKVRASLVIIFNMDKHNYTDEKKFIAALLANNESAFCYLVESMYNQLVTVARAIAGPSIADEIVQESWISVLKALPKFEGRSTLKTWITQIVANEAKKRLRKESRQVSLDSLSADNDHFLDRFDANGHWARPPASWDLSTPEDILDEKLLKLCIDKTVKILPEKQKAVFSLRYLDDYSLEEICNILEVSHSNIRVLLHRARLVLYQTIEHFQETGEC